ncbi:hypothetical protein M514_03600 [Trichuris suis]|uniref:Uncharacterized protein n=1 Tax=Trichuris suis TaxID=68888 RepID=A0A085N0I1_9BILA|nr:hypothetical protein M514_03600 [Trichuris suis]
MATVRQPPRREICTSEASLVHYSWTRNKKLIPMLALALAWDKTFDRKHALHCESVQRARRKDIECPMSWITCKPSWSTFHALWRGEQSNSRD